MTYYTIFSTEHMNEGILEKLKAVCSAQRIRNMERYRRISDRISSCAVYALLRYGLEREYGITRMPCFSFQPYGKPRLSEKKDIHFNMSHSGGMIGVSISDKEIGCDIQMDIEDYDDVLQRTGSSVEQRLVNDKRSFTRLWTVKESYFKCLGTGLSDDLGDYALCISDQKIFRTAGKVFTTQSMEGGALAVCSDKEEKICYVDPLKLCSGRNSNVDHI